MSFLNQIFYNYNKFDSYEDFESINKYMLFVENKPTFLSKFSYIDYTLKIKYDESSPQIIKQYIQPAPKYDMNNIPPPPEQYNKNCINNIPPQLTKLFCPIQENKLFWCIYISVYGYNNYLLINQKYGNKELEEKQLIIEFIKQNTPKWKNVNYKVSKKLIQEMMSELLINKHSGWLTCVSMSVYYNKIIMLVNQPKNSYIYFSPNKEVCFNQVDDFENIILLYYNKNDISHNKNKNSSTQQITYSIDLQNIDQTDFVKQIKEFQMNMYCLENYEKPLKGVSTYKMKDLENIANKLNIFSNITENTILKKQELYDKIYSYCLW